MTRKFGPVKIACVCLVKRCHPCFVSHVSLSQLSPSINTPRPPLLYPSFFLPCLSSIRTYVHFSSSYKFFLPSFSENLQLRFHVPRRLLKGEALYFDHSLLFLPFFGLGSRKILLVNSVG